MAAVSADPLPEITLSELAARSPATGLRIVDVRSPAEFDRDHIPGFHLQSFASR